MRRHLPAIEIERLQYLADIKKRYALGAISLEEAKRQLKEKVGKLRPYHYALMEQTMTEENPEECFKENLSELNKLLEEMMDCSIPTLPDDHPIRHYYRENEEMRRVLNAAEDLAQYPVIKNQWLELLDKASAYLIHYTRKQNQLYPILEKKGFDRPTVTMWTFDDMISNSVKKLRPLLEANDEEAFIAQVKELIPYLRDLMDKEEAILYPTSLALIKEEEFEEMKSGDQEIGFAFFEVAGTEKKKDDIRPTDSFAQELQSLLAKHGYAVGRDQPLDVTTGKLTLEQINLIYQHLPFDISFVNEDELVQFYSDTDHRIFPRSKNVIGRKVENCHPRKSVHIVREIVEKMRSGEQSKAEFWIDKPNLFIYITYYAVRDKRGDFRGILEVMQDCTHIRSLTGSRTLLTWADEEGTPTTTPDATTAEPTENRDDNAKQATEINEDTKLKDLFSQYPGLKEDLARQYAPFKMLQTALGKLILKKATIKMAGERSGLGTQKLIAMIRQAIHRDGQS